MFGGEKGDDLLPMITEMLEAGREVKPEHVEPDLMLASAAMLDLFWELHGWRKSGGMGGPARIDLADLTAYCSFNGFMLRSFEVLAIRTIDNLYLSNWKPLESK